MQENIKGIGIICNGLEYCLAYPGVVFSTSSSTFMMSCKLLGRGVIGCWCLFFCASLAISTIWSWSGKVVSPEGNYDIL